jgi:serine/threonine-protein kinase
VAVSNMSAKVDPVPVPTASNLAATEEPTPDPKPSDTRRASSPTPTVRPPTKRPQPATVETTKEPVEKPTPSNSPTPTTSKSPTPTPTPKPRKEVPHTVDLPYPKARQLILEAGFTVQYEDQTGGEVQPECLQVVQSFPDGGELLELKKPVKLVLVEGDLCLPGSPTPTPSSSVTASKG